jgi:flagellar hook-associated protein 3 FlgL
MTQRNIAGLLVRQADASRQASTGKRIGAPSDDPTASAALVRLKAAMENNKRFQDNVRDARGDVELVESNLAQIGDLFTRVRELVLQGGNAWVSNTDRDAMANEIVQLRAQLGTIANVKGSRGYLFSGSQVETQPFDATGTFQGDDGDHQVEIAPGVMANVGVSGAKAFTAAGGIDVFDVLDSVENALRADDSQAIFATLTGIDQASSQLFSARTDSGLILSRLDTADTALEQTSLLMSKRQSALGDADAFASISDLSRLSTTLEQAIAVARVTLNIGGSSE